MYILSNSLLEQTGECRVEMYTMKILKCDAQVEIEMKIFGEGELEVYMAEYVIIKSEDETSSGTILEYDDKERAILLIEEVAIRVLEDESFIW